MEKLPKSSLTSVDNRLKSSSAHQKNRREEQVNKYRNLDTQGVKEENPRKFLSKGLYDCTYYYYFFVSIDQIDT